MSNNLYYNKQLLSGICKVPRLTQSEYDNLTTKPEFWILKDNTGNYKRLNAIDVEYDLGDGNTSNVQDQLDNVEDFINRNAAKNVLPFPYISANNSLFTADDNGIITITSGAVSARSIHYLTHHETLFTLPVGKYILSKGFTSPSSSPTLYIVVDGCTSSGWVKNLAKSLDTDEVEFEVDYDGYDRIEVYVCVDNGYTVPENTVLYPMIRIASDCDPSFKPYVMTNREITYQLNTNRLTRFRASGSRYTDAINIQLNPDKVSDGDFIIFQAFIVGSNTIGPVQILVSKDSVNRAKAILTYVNANETLMTVYKICTWDDTNKILTIPFDASEQVAGNNWLVLDLYYPKSIIKNFYITSHL